MHVHRYDDECMVYSVYIQPRTGYSILPTIIQIELFINTERFRTEACSGHRKC